MGRQFFKNVDFSVTYPLKGVQVTFGDSFLLDSVRCLSVLDLVILFYLFIFFLGREAQKVRQWGVNSLKTSIFPLPTHLRGCRSLLEIVFFVGQCEVFVCLGFGHFILFVYYFPWPRSSKGPPMGRQFFKNVDFSVTYPLKGVQVTFGDSFFVGQCEVFVCLGFGHFILFVYFFPWPRSSKGPPMGRQFFKNVDFSVTYPLKGVQVTFGDSFFVGQCEVFVCLGFGHFILFVYFFPWPRSSKGPPMGRQFFENVDFSVTYPLQGCKSLLEIFFFVGQFEVFVCLGFGHFILFVYFFPWPRSSKGPPMGRQFFKNVDFSVTYPLKWVQVTFGDSFLQDSVRCLSVLDLVILFYLFLFFLGREAQKVREWGVNSLKTSIFPLPTPLRGCRSLLEIVFLQDSVRCLSVLDLVILFYLFIFFLGRKAQKVREWGVNSLKTSIFPLPTPLRGCRSLLEIVFCRTV